MTLEISTVDTAAQTLHLRLSGELDAFTTPVFERFLDGRLGEHVGTLVLDLQALNFISSAGLRAFAKTRKLIKAQGGQLCYVNLSPQVRKVFDIVKATPVHEVFASLEELDSYLKTVQDRISDA